MNRIHAFAIAGLLAIAAAAGLFAVTRTADVGAATTVPETQVQARERQLDRAEQQVDALRSSRPPAVQAGTPPSSPAPAAVAISSGRSHEIEHEDEHEDEHHGRGRGRGRGRGHGEDD
jgi:hypothetical protein